MNFTDFEYNGRRLSEYECMICVINGTTGAETVDVGNKIKFNTINNQSKNNSNRFKYRANKEIVDLVLIKKQKLIENEM